MLSTRSCRRDYTALILSLMICSAHGTGSWRRQSLAMAMSARLSFSFRTPTSSYYTQQASRSLFNSGTSCSYSRPHHSAVSQRRASIAAHSVALQQTPIATSGWIKTSTLNFEGDCYDENSNRINQDECDVKMKFPSPSSVERLLVRDRLVYIKRDDAFHLPSSNVSGNKARKFLSLNTIPASDFPDVVVSYGGPQSNAMVALAAIVSSKNAELSGNALGPDDWQGPSLGSKDGEDMFWQLDVSDDEASNGQSKDGGSNKQSSKEGQSSSSHSATSDTNETVPKKRFIYYTKTMPRYLRKYPNGNLLRAQTLGMEIRTVPHDEYNQLFGGLNGGSVMAPADLDPPVPGKSLWIPQGGACSIAQPGSDVLAQEIVDYWALNGKGIPLAVCVPGGTCTTALLLHRSINSILEQRKKSNTIGEEELDIRLIVIPCVGDDEYAMRQMISLDRSVGGRGRPEDMPYILKPRTGVEYGSARKRSKGYFTFGQPAKAILQTYDEMNENGVFLDLLYGAPAWSLLLQHWRSRDDDCPFAGRQVMYIHSGGLEGVASQLTRYKHKGLLEARTIQTS